MYYDIMSKYKVFDDSRHVAHKDTVSLGSLEENHQISTTWILNSGLKQSELHQLVIDITTFCIKHGLQVVADHSHHLKVTGIATNFNKAFLVSMRKYQKGNRVYHATPEPIQIPIEWDNKVLNILGLNTKPIARSYVKVATSNALSSTD